MGVEVYDLKVSFDKTHILAGKLLETLEREKAQVSYGMLACALVLGKLSNYPERLTEEEEMKFVQDTMDFTRAYWGVEA